MFNPNHPVVTKHLPAQDEKRELTFADLDAAAGGGSSKPSGGNLSAHCCTGKHISDASLHM